MADSGIAPSAITHWDDARNWRGEKGHIAGTWYSLTGSGRARSESRASRSTRACGRHRSTSKAPRRRSSTSSAAPGSPFSSRARATRSATTWPEGDCLVHLALENAHTLQAGPEGLDVLAFGQRVYAPGVTWLPRAGVAWLGETWAPVGAEDDHPWTREAAAGPPSVEETSERPSTIVNVADLDPVERDGATVGRRVRYPARKRARGERVSAITRCWRASSMLPPHCHSAEEEIFVVLDGTGDAAALGGEAASKSMPVRRGSIVVRPAGTGVAHAFRAGDAA